MRVLLVGLLLLAAVAEAQPLQNTDAVRNAVGRSAADVAARLGPPRDRMTVDDRRYGRGEVWYYVTWDGFRRRLATLIVINGVVNEVTID